MSAAKAGITKPSSESQANAKIVDFLRRGQMALATEALKGVPPAKQKELVLEGLRELARGKFTALASNTAIAFGMRDDDFQEQLPEGGDHACPNCSSKRITADNVKDVAVSTHYVDDVAEFACHQCGNEWAGQYGYRGHA
jgi:DNA-directed RNA polymerase subunit RPC12/RpoP